MNNCVESKNQTEIIVNDTTWVRALSAVPADLANILKELEDQ